MQTILVSISHAFIFLLFLLSSVAALSTALSIFAVITSWESHPKVQQKKPKSKSEN